MKVGTTGFLRSVRSAWDYFLYFEIRLSRRPVLLSVCLVFWILSSLTTMLFSVRTWSASGWVVSIVFLAPLFAYFREVWRADAPLKPHFVPDNRLKEEAQRAKPTAAEQELGFQRVSRSAGFDGPIIVSDEFNITQMSNPACDWELVIKDDGREYDHLIAQVKNMRPEFVAFGRQKIVSAFLRGKALINEGKVAFAEPFPTDTDKVEIFQTDYFTGLCTTERSLDNVIVQEGMTQRITNSASERFPFAYSGRDITLPHVAKNPRPISLHFGIEVLALSNDGVLRIPVQSRLPQWSQGMRAPLASGSIDWEDAEGADTLKGLIRTAARRELSEEWGARNEALERKLALTRAEPIGYFRSPIRCGKPQFVAIAKLDCADHELLADTSEVYRISDDKARQTAYSRSEFQVADLQQLRAALGNILSKKSEYKDSVALLGAVHCLDTVAQARPEWLAAFLGIPVKPR